MQTFQCFNLWHSLEMTEGPEVEDHEATRGPGAVVITVTKGNDNNHSVI